ncbi:MAG: hypothetical protein ACFFBV_11260 [Promethearchaeota archaeon]
MACRHFDRGSLYDFANPAGTCQPSAGAASTDAGKGASRWPGESSRGIR